MLRIQGAEHFLGNKPDLLLAHGLDRFHVHDRQHRVALDVGIAQGDAAARGNVGRLGQVDDRHRPEQAVDGLQLVGNAQGIGQVHVAIERVEVAGAQHHRVGGGGGIEQQGRQLLRLLQQGGATGVVGNIEGVQLRRAVGLDHDGLRILSVAQALMMPRSRSRARICSTSSSRVCWSEWR